MIKLKKYFDLGSLIVIVITFFLFTIALFTKGITHGILLEAGVLLVSIKLIIMSYKNVDTVESIHKKLDAIYAKLERDEKDEKK